MQRRQPTILVMRVLPRSILVRSLVLLQLASASGHGMHHALEGTVPERCDCTAAAGRMDPSSSATCHQDADTDPPVQHDCNDCFFCDASEAQIARVAQQHRSIENAATACPLSNLAAPDPFAGAGRGLPTVPPLTDPATLHAIMLPLLD